VAFNLKNDNPVQTFTLSTTTCLEYAYESRFGFPEDDRDTWSDGYEEDPFEQLPKEKE
jgi:hypothetical protein